MTVKQAIECVLDDVKSLRHELHAHPEIARREFQTAKRVRQELTSCGVELCEPFLETDVVGFLNRDKSGKNMTLRADMDALPLIEQSGVGYASSVKGMAHACGHDGHTAMLVGAAKVLAGMADKLNGSVRFVFQPGEEVVAAGADLVRAGAIDDPLPDCVLALHGSTDLPVGHFASRPGGMCAAGDMFMLTVIGRGGHGAYPQDAVNPIPIAAAIVHDVHAIAAKLATDDSPVVATICRFDAGANSNIIPDRVVMEGTGRSFDAALSRKIEQAVRDSAAKHCEAFGARFELDYRRPYSATINDVNVVQWVERIVCGMAGDDHWHHCAPTMGSEDFGYYLEKYPGAICRLGLGTDRPDLHHPEFDFNDDALAAGIGFFVHAVLEFLA